MYEIRRAAPKDLNQTLDIVFQRIEWLREGGSDQWSTRSNWQEVFEEAIYGQRVWLAVDGLWRVAGTVTVDSTPDLDFWSAARDGRSLYLSKMATSLADRGMGLGGVLLDWANNYAAQKGFPSTRIDVWRTATRLHEYYQRHGFQHARTVDVTGRYSGALFERPATLVPVRWIPPKDASCGITESPVM